MKRDAVLERLEPMLKTTVREVEHTSGTQVLFEPHNVAIRPTRGARLLELTHDAVKSLAKVAGMPEGMPPHLSPRTCGSALSELLQGKKHYSLILKDGAVVDVVSKTACQPVNAERLLTTIDRAIPEVDYHRILTLPHMVTSLEVIGEQRKPVVRGDLIQAGTNIVFSPIGTIDPTVQAYCLRLACTNGATSNDVLREFTRSGGGGGGGEGDDVWQWFRKAIRQSYNAIDGIAGRYREMIDQGIAPEHRAHVLEAMIREARLPEEAAEAVRALAIESPPANRYDIHNFITRAASHLVREPEEVRRAQHAAADYAGESTDRRECPLCHNRN